MSKESMFNRPALPDKFNVSEVEKERQKDFWIALNRFVRKIHENQSSHWHDDYDTSVEMIIDSDAKVQQFILDHRYEEAAKMIVEKVESEAYQARKNKIKNRRTYK